MAWFSRRVRGVHIGCSLLVVVVGLVVASPCVFVGVLLYQEGAFDRPPSMPSDARPVGADKLGSETPPCDMTDDFGPNYRAELFGTEQTFEELRIEKEAVFRDSGWDVAYGVNAEAMKSLYFSMRKGDVRVSYRVRSFAGLNFYNQIAEHQDSYRTLVIVSVSDCAV